MKINCNFSQKKKKKHTHDFEKYFYKFSTISFDSGTNNKTFRLEVSPSFVSFSCLAPTSRLPSNRSIDKGKC